MNYYLILFAVIFSCEIISANVKNAFSREEQRALEMLRPLVSDVLHQDYMQEDVYLIQWLRATNLDAAKATQAIRKAHQWRKDTKIDTFADEDWSIFRREFPLSISGHDLEGRPLMVVKISPWDVRKAVLQGRREKMNRYLEHMLELCATKARQTFNDTISTATGVRDVPDMVFIHDLNGYTLKQHGCLACIPAMLTYSRDTDLYYAYSVKNSYITNTPRIFENVLQLVRNLISEHTNRILKVFGVNKREWMDHFSTIIAPDQLKLHYSLTWFQQ